MAMVAWMPSSQYEALARHEALSSLFSMSNMDPPAHARWKVAHSNLQEPDREHNPMLPQAQSVLTWHQQSTVLQ